MSRLACLQVIEELRQKPTALIGLATGATPRRAYELLAERGQDEPDVIERGTSL